MEGKEFNYKDFYKPERLNGSSQLFVKHLLNKHESDFGILEIIRSGTPLRYGVNQKELLEKALRYYHGQPDTEIFWFYTSDLKKLEKEDAHATT
jgi:hypothetical protein